MTHTALKSHPVSIAIDGMTCASCLAWAERALPGVPSVTSASVAVERATVELRNASTALLAAGNT